MGLLWIWAAGDALAVNKCVDVEGNISFQDQPCPDGAATETIDPRTGAAVSPALPVFGEGPEADDDSEDEAILALVSVQATYEGCAMVSEGFAERHAALLARWKTANATALAQFGNSGRHRMLMERGLQQMRLGAASSARTQLARFCEVQFIPSLVPTLGD